MEIPIQVNGDTLHVSQGTTVAQLLERLGKQPRYLAVERNQVLVPRGQHIECVLLADDQIEIVTLVGGG